MTLTTSRRAPVRERVAPSERVVGPSRASRVVEGLRRIYCAPAWLLVEQVSLIADDADRAGPYVPEKRLADAIAVSLIPGRHSFLRMVFFEVKVDPADAAEEWAHPEKSAPFARYAWESYVAVPAPRKSVIADLDAIHQGWGCFEVGEGKPVEVLSAKRNTAPEPPPPALLAALFRAKARSEASVDSRYPMVAVKEWLNRHHTRVLLECGHATVAAQPKGEPPKALPCALCLEDA